MLFFVGTGFKRWMRGGDQSDDVLNAGTNGGLYFEQLILLSTDAEYDITNTEELNSRGVFLLKYFKCLGGMADMDKAISYLDDAVRPMPDGHVDNSGR